MNYTEQTIVFACAQDMLTGILATPGANASTGVIVIVGGPQYRVGSHRQFVLLSRALAAAGYPVLRFDYRGMGDSEGVQRDFTQVSQDIAAAIGAMQAHLPSVERVVLWGLCDGASAALTYCHDTNDARVCGLCLLNPWVRSAASLARAQVKHYYGQRLRQKEFWVKLLSGKVAVSAITSLWRNVRLMGSRAGVKAGAQQLPFQQRMASAWNSFGGSLLLLLSGNDYTAKEFVEYAAMDAAWAGLLVQAQVVRHDLPDADHTFSDAASRTRVEVLTVAWLRAHMSQ